MRRKAGALLSIEIAQHSRLVLLRGSDPEFHGYAMAREIRDQRARGLTAHGSCTGRWSASRSGRLLASRWEDLEIAAAEERPRRRMYRDRAEGEAAAQAVAESAKALARRLPGADWRRHEQHHCRRGHERQSQQWHLGSRAADGGLHADSPPKYGTRAAPRSHPTCGSTTATSSPRAPRVEVRWERTQPHRARRTGRPAVEIERRGTEDGHQDSVRARRGRIAAGDGRPADDHDMDQRLRHRPRGLRWRLCAAWRT